VEELPEDDDDEEDCKIAKIEDEAAKTEAEKKAERELAAAAEEERERQERVKRENEAAVAAVAAAVAAAAAAKAEAEENQALLQWKITGSAEVGLLVGKKFHSRMFLGKVVAWAPAGCLSVETLTELGQGGGGGGGSGGDVYKVVFHDNDEETLSVAELTVCKQNVTRRLQTLKNCSSLCKHVEEFIAKYARAAAAVAATLYCVQGGGGWMEYMTGEGRKYYHRAGMHVSQWLCPREWSDIAPVTDIPPVADTAPVAEMAAVGDQRESSRVASTCTHMRNAHFGEGLPYSTAVKEEQAEESEKEVEEEEEGEDKMSEGLTLATERELTLNEVAGGFQKGDRVRLLSDLYSVAKGSVGLVKGCCFDESLVRWQERVMVAFDVSGRGQVVLDIVQWSLEYFLASGLQKGVQARITAGEASGHCGVVTGPCRTSNVIQREERVTVVLDQVPVSMFAMHLEYVSLAGNYQKGDRVRSGITLVGSTTTIKRGALGTVTGPCNNYLLPHTDQRVAVQFDTLPTSSKRNYFPSHLELVASANQKILQDANPPPPPPPPPPPLSVPPMPPLSAAVDEGAALSMQQADTRIRRPSRVCTQEREREQERARERERVAHVSSSGGSSSEDDANGHVNGSMSDDDDSAYSDCRDASDVESDDSDLKDARNPLPLCW